MPIAADVEREMAQAREALTTVLEQVGCRRLRGRRWRGSISWQARWGTARWSIS